ncbi:MAG: DUF2007 domain-containing protein [Massilibacteroides sp.]|nr:DUF2007 domain-containing protein [Massilibacteroides sp.]
MKQEKMVEVARFQSGPEAQIAASLLRSEKIEFYLNNEYTSQVFSGIDLGGTRIKVLEENAPKAIQILVDGGFENDVVEPEI